MNTEDMDNGITLLEDIINSPVLDLTDLNININQLSKYLTKISTRQNGGNLISSEKSNLKKSSSSESHEKQSSSSDSTSEYSVATGDSQTIGEILLPSEIFVANKIRDQLHHTSPHQNLAMHSSKSSKIGSDTSKIIDFQSRTEKSERVNSTTGTSKSHIKN